MQYDFLFCLFDRPLSCSMMSHSHVGVGLSLEKQVPNLIRPLYLYVSMPLCISLEGSSNNRVLLELSHDRMIALAALENTVLLNPSIYPAIKYYLRQGEVFLP